MFDTANKLFSDHLFFSVVIKECTLRSDVLQHLGSDIGDDWKKLGRRLKVTDAQLEEINGTDDKLAEKAYRMLIIWKQKGGSAATYKKLNNALINVGRKDLAERHCCRRQSSAP